MAHKFAPWLHDPNCLGAKPPQKPTRERPWFQWQWYLCLPPQNGSRYVGNLPACRPILILSPALKRWGPPGWREIWGPVN